MMVFAHTSRRFGDPAEVRIAVAVIAVLQFNANETGEP
jgi:hypothetical protein